MCCYVNINYVHTIAYVRRNDERVDDQKLRVLEQYSRFTLWQFIGGAEAEKL